MNFIAITMQTRVLVGSLGAGALFVAIGAAAHHNAGHGGGPGGSGPGENEDTLLQATFQCPAPPCPIDSDGGGIYVDGDNRVTVHISSNGHILFDVGARKNRQPARNFTWNLSVGGNSLIVSSGEYFDSDDIGFAGHIYGSKIQINRRLGVDLLNMPIGVDTPIDMWADLTIYDQGHPTLLLGRFDAETGTNPLAQNECIGLASDDVSIRRETDTRWVVSAPDLAVSCALIMDPNGDPGLWEQNFLLGPFRIVFDAI